MNTSIHLNKRRTLLLACIVQAVLLVAMTSGARAQALLSIDTASIFSGNDVVVGTTAYDTITFSNTGSANLTLDSIYFTGNSSATYTVMAGFDSTVLPLGMDTLIVAVRPSVTGSATDTLNFASNAGLASLPLTITGVAPMISIDTVGSVFDSMRVRLGRTAYDTLTITNTGTADLTIDSAYIGGQNSNQYTIVTMPSATIAPDSSSTLIVAYSPLYSGTYRDTLYLQSNADTLALPLTGAGITPAISISTNNINFDTVSISSQSCRPIDITNTGTDTLAITSNTLSTTGSAYYFYALSGSDTLIAPGQTRAIGVCFIPSTPGQETATIALRTDIPFDTTTRYITITGTAAVVSTATASNLTIPNGIVGVSSCATDTLSVAGDTNPITITGISVTGADAGAVTVTPSTGFPTNVSVGQQFVYNVCITPTHAGAQDATVQVSYTTLGLSRSVSVPLTTNALTACAQANATTLFNTRTFIGTTDTARVTVTNCGQVPTTYTASLPIGLTNYQAIGSLTSPTVNAGGSTTFTFVYTPTTTVADTGNLIITGNGVAPMVIALNGSGGTVSITSTGTVPDVIVGNCQDFTITLNNAGNMAWTSGNVMISGANAADFTATTFTGAMLGADSNATMTLRFCPTTVGSETATLTFPNAAPNANTQIVLTGRGLASSGVADGTESQQLGISAVYPNPSSNSATISYYLPSDGNVTLQLVDVTGAARVLATGHSAQGAHQLTVDTKPLPNGSYFIIMDADGQHIVKQLSVVH